MSDFYCTAHLVRNFAYRGDDETVDEWREVLHDELPARAVNHAVRGPKELRWFAEYEAVVILSPILLICQQATWTMRSAQPMAFSCLD
jgi:hypothetical protein